MKRHSLCLILALLSTACGDTEADVGYVRLKNDFDNPAMERRPPWTICKSSFQGVELGAVTIGSTGDEKEVPAGIDYVLMVAAWNDPTCSPASALPLASKSEEEVVTGQHRTIAIHVANHQGPCPPEGVQPIPEAQYERIRALWPEFGFKPYAERTQNSQCAK